MTVGSLRHPPKRPKWICDTCPDAPAWPCLPARVELAERYADDRLGLAVYVPRQRAVDNTGGYDGRRQSGYTDPNGYADRDADGCPSPEPGLLMRIVVAYVSGAAWCAGFLTVTAATLTIGTWLFW